MSITALDHGEVDSFFSELQQLFRDLNVQNFQHFQHFEQSYQRYLLTLEGPTTHSSSSSAAEEGYQSFLYDLMLTNQRLQQNLSSICLEISSLAERVAAGSIDHELSEEKRQRYLSYLEKQYTILQNLLQIWNLLEIFAINISSKFIVFDLLPWLQLLRYSIPEYYRSFQIMTHPERFEGDGGKSLEFSFWEVVYDNILQGNLKTAIEFLKLHSELSGYFSQKQKNNERILTIGRVVPKEQVAEFFQLLESYPYTQCLNTLMPSPIAEPLSNRPAFQNIHEREEFLTNYFLRQHPNLGVEFSRWQENLQQYRDTSHLLTQIPELDFILRLLQGEQRAIEVQSKQNWNLLCLGQLLFRYPCHQLTKVNLRRIIDEILQQSFPMAHLQNQQHQLRLAAPSLEELSLLYREIMKGNTALLMKTIYEASYTSFDELLVSPLASPLTNHFCATILLQLVHLSRLLVIGGNVQELVTPLRDSPHQVSFFEEIVLETSERLAQLHYPHEILRGYLSLSSQYGSLFYRQLLLRQPIQTDEECVKIAQALEEARFHSDSHRMYSLRGRFWLKHNGNYAALREDIASNAALAGRRSDANSTLAKAAHFYFLGKDYTAVELLLESSLYRCMYAVVDCSRVYFLEKLHYYPGKPVLPQRPGQEQKRQGHSTLKAKSDVVRSKEDLTNNTGSSKEEVTTEQAQQRVEYLDYALHEAEALLQSLLPHLSPHNSREEELLSSLKQQFASLLHYSKAITSLLLPASSPVNSSFREAAELISQLLVPNPSSVQTPLISTRYWLHLLELSYFIHHLIASLELKQSLDHSFLLQLSDFKIPNDTSVSEVGAALDDTMIIEDSTVASTPKTGSKPHVNSRNVLASNVLSGFGQPIFSKGVIGQLHVLLVILEQQSDFPWILELCSPPNGYETAEEELRRQLKMNLLSLLTSTYLVSSHSHFTKQPQALSSGRTDMDQLTLEPAIRVKSASGARKDEKKEEEYEHPKQWQFYGLSEKEEEEIAVYELSNLLDGSAFLFSE